MSLLGLPYSYYNLIYQMLLPLQPKLAYFNSQNQYCATSKNKCLNLYNIRSPPTHFQSKTTGSAQSNPFLGATALPTRSSRKCLSIQPQTQAVYNRLIVKYNGFQFFSLLQTNNNRKLIKIELKKMISTKYAFW